MELTHSKPPKQKQNRQQTLPPPRGQIKRRIIKGLFKSVSAAIFSKKPKHNGGDFTTSKSSTPAAISSGYNSDVPSES